MKNLHTTALVMLKKNIFNILAIYWPIYFIYLFFNKKYLFIYLFIANPCQYIANILLNNPAYSLVLTNIIIF